MLTWTPQELKDRNDERPQVVQLSQNDMTAEEAKQHWDKEEAAGKKTDDLSEGEISIFVNFIILVCIDFECMNFSVRKCGKCGK